MTNEEIINTLKSLKSYYNDKSDYCEDGYVGFDDEDNEAIDIAIKLLEQTRWIPISERLPDKEGKYLVTIFRQGYRHKYVVTSNFVCHDFDFFWEDGGGVIAWMPLPEPPDLPKEKCDNE